MSGIWLLVSGILIYIAITLPVLITSDKRPQSTTDALTIVCFGITILIMNILAHITGTGG